MMNTIRSTPPLITGHRGAGGEQPENSLTAFRHAAEIGCDAVELDVHLTRDGVPVVVHDPAIRNEAGEILIIRNSTADEICSVSISNRDFIPRLDQVLNLLADTNLNIQVELKGEDVIEAAVSEIRNIGLEHQVTFTSFFHQRVLDARKALPGVGATGVLLSGVPVNIIEVARSAQADNVHLQHGRITEDLVERLHEADLRIVAWGIIKTNEQFDRLFELGVDALGSDWPTALIRRRNLYFDDSVKNPLQ